MQKKQVLYGCILVIIAAVIFIFAEGARRWYSGIFFMLLGCVTLARAKWGPKKK